MKCKFGCEQEAIYKDRCSKHHASCPAIKEKYKQTNHFKIRGNYIKRNCQYCNSKTSSSSLQKHENGCYLNPENIKFCPICNSPIKDYKNTKTCSRSCANTLFRSGKNHPNWNEDYYRTTCFQYHQHKCIICDENKIVDVHHFDGNRNNNEPDNFIPLCPTHHYYIHRGLENLIKDKLIKYRNDFIKSKFL